MVVDAGVSVYGGTFLVALYEKDADRSVRFIVWLPWGSPIGSGWGGWLGSSLCDVVGVRSIVRIGVIDIEVVQNDVLVLRSIGGDPAQ